MEKEKEENWFKKNSILIIGTAFLLFVTISWFYSYYFITSNYCKEDWGIIGDMFGGINSLFSGLAFVGLIFTILLQRKELQEQRKELKMTRKVFLSQNELTKIQLFENTFFKIIEKIKENIIPDYTLGLRDEMYHSKVLTSDSPPSDILVRTAVIYFNNNHDQKYFMEMVNSSYMIALVKLIKQNIIVNNLDINIYREILIHKISRENFKIIQAVCMFDNKNFPINFSKDFLEVFFIKEDMKTLKNRMHKATQHI